MICLILIGVVFIGFVTGLLVYGTACIRKNCAVFVVAPTDMVNGRMGELVVNNGCQFTRLVEVNTV